jgi:hypothetical protein
MSARLRGGLLIQGRIWMSGWAAGRAARGGADACNHGAPSALWTCTKGARRFANGIHSDPSKLIFGRLMILDMERLVDMLLWPEEQDPNVV